MGLNVYLFLREKKWFVFALIPSIGLLPLTAMLASLNAYLCLTTPVESECYTKISSSWFGFWRGGYNSWCQLQVPWSLIFCLLHFSPRGVEQYQKKVYTYLEPSSVVKKCIFIKKLNQDTKQDAKIWNWDDAIQPPPVSLWPAFVVCAWQWAFSLCVVF